MSLVGTLQGVGLWALAMAVPAVMMYSTNATVRVLLLSFIYPAMISYFCRMGHFWVSHASIMIAAGVTLIFGFLVKMSPTASDAIEDPKKNPGVTGAVIGSMLAVFLLTMFLAAKFGPSLYNVSEFANANNNGGKNSGSDYLSRYGL